MTDDDRNLLDFWQDNGFDGADRGLPIYFTNSDDWWERNHNHIQWAFPIPEPSRAVPASPAAADDFYDEMKSNPLMQARLIMLTGRFLSFLENSHEWVNEYDHNHLRITRVIRCLALCGMDEMASTVYKFAYNQIGGTVPEDTVAYWRAALSSHVVTVR